MDPQCHGACHLTDEDLGLEHVVCPTAPLSPGLSHPKICGTQNPMLGTGDTEINQKFALPSRTSKSHEEDTQVHNYKIVGLVL